MWSSLLPRGRTTVVGGSTINAASAWIPCHSLQFFVHCVIQNTPTLPVLTRLAGAVIVFILSLVHRGCWYEARLSRQDVDFNSPEIVRVLLIGRDEDGVWRPGAAISYRAAVLPVTEILWDRLLHAFLAHSRRGCNVFPTSYKPVPAVVNAS